MYWRTLDLNVNTDLKLTLGRWHLHTGSPWRQLSDAGSSMSTSFRMEDRQTLFRWLRRWTWGSICCSGRYSLQLHLHHWTTMIRLPLWVNRSMLLHGKAVASLLGGDPGSYGALLVYMEHVLGYIQDMSCPQEEKLKIF